MSARGGAAEAPDATAGALLASAITAIGRSATIDHWQPSLARWDAEQLLSEATGRPVTAALKRSILTAAERSRFEAMVTRRVAGEPIARIAGYLDFRGMRLLVRNGVFVPRVSSELLAEEAIARLRRRRGQRAAVDVATGSGPMALAMAKDVPDAEVWGLDISRDAVKLCRANARRAGVRNAHFRVSDMLDALPSR